jgi:hypothetical protein
LMILTLTRRLFVYGVEWKDEWWRRNWKGFQRKWSFLYLTHYPGIYFTVLKRTIKHLIHYSVSTDRDLNLATSRYEAGLLPTGIKFPLLFIWLVNFGNLFT